MARVLRDDRLQALEARATGAEASSMSARELQNERNDLIATIERLKRQLAAQGPDGVTGSEPSRPHYVDTPPSPEGGQ